VPNRKDVSINFFRLNRKWSRHDVTSNDSQPDDRNSENVKRIRHSSIAQNWSSWVTGLVNHQLNATRSTIVRIYFFNGNVSSIHLNVPIKGTKAEMCRCWINRNIWKPLIINRQMYFHRSEPKTDINPNRLFSVRGQFYIISLLMLINILFSSTKQGSVLLKSPERVN
jgi:hypothetical protein